MTEPNKSIKTFMQYPEQVSVATELAQEDSIAVQE
jgi:hypothetical protein